MRLKTLLSIAALVFAAGTLPAAPDKPIELAPEEQQQLQRDKVLITNRSHRQIFTPYIFSPMPVFITSDSLLNAWHVLLEESFVALEERFCAELTDALGRTLAEIEDAPDGMQPDMFAEAAQYARIVLGTAAKLSGGKWSGGAELDGIIAEEVKHVEAAGSLRLPAWLPPDEEMQALDFAVFKPAGFYTRSERMKRYFRALRWLQTIPFRANREEEMTAMELLIPALENSHTVPDIARLHQSLGGGAADADVLSVLRGREGDTGYDLRQWLSDNDRARQPRSRLMVLSALLPSDAAVLRRTTDEKRPFPNGLEIAGFLGSSFAMEMLRAQAGEALTQRIDESRTAWERDGTLYNNYLRCLSLLFNPPEPDAPEFLKTPAWQRMNLNAALAGWAQLRHTWALQTKDDAMWLRSTEPIAGFVEPNPEFFRHLGRLIAESIEIFETRGALEISPKVLAGKARDLLPTLEREIAAQHERIAPFEAIAKTGRELTAEEYQNYSEAANLSGEFRDRLTEFAHILASPHFVTMPGNEVTYVSDPQELLHELRAMADGKREQQIRTALRDNGVEFLRSRWKRLHAVCHQLETLAHKQLRGVVPSEDELHFISGYGRRLGGIMFYDGNSYNHPRDDAPRIATVFNRPGGKCLLAGVGRPREIRVLYPWKGKEIECRGAVMPYHEFVSETRPTDAEWLERLAGKEPPPLPEWLKPIHTPLPPAEKKPDAD